METQKFFELLAADVKSDNGFNLMRQFENAHVFAALYRDGDVRGYIFSSFEKAYETLQKSYFNAAEIYNFFMIIPLNSPIFD